MKQLKDLDRTLVCGYECDVRYLSGRPYLHHDVGHEHEQPDSLADLTSSSQGLEIILNFKETGHEVTTLQEVLPQCVNALILDIPFPEVVKTTKSGFGGSVMWRLSEYEKPPVAQLLDFKARWLWLDSFHEYWFSPQDLYPYKNAGLQICLASNELHGRHIDTQATRLTRLQKDGSYLDAVCTKHPEWYVRKEFSAPKL